jgi:hypothetical protein
MTLWRLVTLEYAVAINMDLPYAGRRLAQRRSPVNDPVEGLIHETSLAGASPLLESASHAKQVPPFPDRHDPTR